MRSRQPSAIFSACCCWLFGAGSDKAPRLFLSGGRACSGITRHSASLKLGRSPVASFAAAASVTQDVLVTDASGTSEAFNILDQMIMGMDAIRNTLGDATPTALSARWTWRQLVAWDPSITSPNSSQRSPLNFISCICSIG